VSKPELSEVIAIFHKGSDSLTQYFAEQGRSDNDMLLAFDEIDKFLSSAELSYVDQTTTKKSPTKQSTPDEVFNDPKLKEVFDARANELVLLIDRLMVFSSQIQHQESFAWFEEFLYLFTLWYANLGGTIIKLIPIVNLVAAFSNRLKDPQALRQLMVNIKTIIEAVDQSIQDDMDDRDPRRPWRVLLLNYAITATRTHDPALMEKAFQFLIHHLPDDLRQFFTEGMSQMTAIDYPPQVKEVMEKYYWQYATQEIKKN